MTTAIEKELKEIKAKWQQTQQELEETKAKLWNAEELLELSQLQLTQAMETLEQYQSQMQETMGVLEQFQDRKENIASNERLYKIENAIVERIEIVSNNEWVGGLACSEEIPGIFRHRRAGEDGKPVYLDKNVPGKSIEKPQSEFYSGTYIYGGCFNPHFGHALTESIHRLWAFNNNIHEGIVFALALQGSKNTSLPAYTPPQWFIQILELLEIPLAKCIWVTDTCVFENLVVPEPGSELTLGPKPWYSSYLKKLQQRIFQLTDNLKKQDLKLFLGRTHLLMNGSVAGENYLENLLVKDGYTSIQLEKYSLIQQLAFIASASKIVFLEGSSIYSLELLEYLDTEIACIPRRPHNLLYHSHIQSKCRNYIVAGKAENCMRLGSYNMKDGPNAISISKVPFQIIESLRNSGFAPLKDWNEEEFLSEEKSDIMRYINNGSTLLNGANKVHCSRIMEKYLQVRNQSLIESNNRSVSKTLNNMELKQRHARLNKLASINQSSRYLEIGVNEGQTFNAIDIEHKVAVDLKFLFNKEKYATDKVVFLEVSSDEFFSSYAKDFMPFDLIYLDGLHTFEQTFRDFCASISGAHSRTIWLIDDTCPGSYAQAQPSHQLCQKLKKISGEKNKSWMGDVFKVVAAIHDFFPQFSFATFPDHGQTVVWKKWRTDFQPQWNSLEKISRLEYSDLAELQASLFKRESYENIFEKIKRDFVGLISKETFPQKKNDEVILNQHLITIGFIEKIVVENTMLCLEGWVSSFDENLVDGFKVFIEGQEIENFELELELLNPNLKNFNKVAFCIRLPLNQKLKNASDALIILKPLLGKREGMILVNIIKPSIPIPSAEYLKWAGGGGEGGAFLKNSLSFLGYFIQLTGLKPTDSVLEVGSGLGRMAYSLAYYLKPPGIYEGFEIMAKFIKWPQEEISTRRPHFNFRLANIYNHHYNPGGNVQAKDFIFPYEDDSFDLVFLTSVFTHMQTEEVRHYLKQIYRVLKYGGKCLCSCFLLNQESEKCIGEGKSGFNFVYELNECFTTHPDNPEAAIAFKESLLLNWIRESGFAAIGKYYGSWCGRNKYTSGQDILIVQKQK